MSDSGTQDLSSHAPFVVTGASGYVASWVVWELLSRGATVRGTVRDPANTQKCQHLHDMAKELPGALELWKADLLTPGSFDDAVVGASVVAIYGDAKELQAVPGGAFTEENWNTTSSADHQAYSYSKTLAEKAAWEMNKAQTRWQLAVINPGFIFGPSKTARTDSESIKMITDVLKGRFKFGAPALWFAGVVDVRDVAKAHVEAAIRSDAEGRHILVNRSLTFLDMGKILRKRIGGKYPFPKSTIHTFLLYLVGPFEGLTWQFIRKNVGYPLHFNNTRSRERLGIEYGPVEDTLAEHAEQLIAARG